MTGSGTIGPVTLGILAAVVGLGIVLLADLTRSRPDPLVPGTSSTVNLVLEISRPRPTEDDGAAALWHTCRLTVPAHTTTELAATGRAGRYTATVSPALGEQGRRRLLGCLRDGTIDRVRAVAATVTDTPPGSAAGRPAPPRSAWT